MMIIQEAQWEEVKQYTANMAQLESAKVPENPIFNVTKVF